jgi:hypothetical protein
MAKPYRQDHANKWQDPGQEPQAANDLVVRPVVGNLALMRQLYQAARRSGTSHFARTAPGFRI